MLFSSSISKCFFSFFRQNTYPVGVFVGDLIIAFGDLWTLGEVFIRLVFKSDWGWGLGIFWGVLWGALWGALFLAVDFDFSPCASLMWTVKTDFVVKLAKQWIHLKPWPPSWTECEAMCLLRLHSWKNPVNVNKQLLFCCKQIFFEVTTYPNYICHICKVLHSRETSHAFWDMKPEKIFLRQIKFWTKLSIVNFFVNSHYTV